MCSCSLCSKGIKLVNNSVAVVLKKQINSMVLQQVENYATNSEFYNRNNLRVLMMFQRKIVESKTKKIFLTTGTTPVK